MNGYNFTERARKVLALARDESRRLHHEYVGTEHILLGLIDEGQGKGAAVLRNLGIDTGAVQQRIHDMIKTGKADTVVGPDLPYTSRAKKVLELTMAEARNLGHDYVGTEHLLLGLLREEKGIAAQILFEAGLREGSARAEVRNLLGHAAELRQKAPAADIVGVAVEIRLANGSVRREDFRSLEAAAGFLNQQ